MTRPSRRAGWIGLAGAVAAAVTLFFSSCEKRSIDVPRGYKGEASRNPYLAAQRLLERLGTPVSSFRELPSSLELDPSEATLILPTPRRSLGRARARELMRWVEDGGHLIVVSWQLFDDENRFPDLVLDPLGVRQYLNESDEAVPEEPEPESPEPGEPEPPDESAPVVTKASTTEAEAEEDEPELARAVFPDRAAPLQVEFDPEYRIELDAEAEDARVFEIGDANGVHLVTVRAGRGLVTALTDDYFLTQPVIADWDHAELVYRLAHFAGRSGPVWIVFGDEFPGALALVWRHGWMVVASAALVLALWLWSASRRFGPIEPDPPAERRELMEHVRAAARFQLRSGAARGLLAATREALLERLRERHPSLATLSPAAQAEQLSELSGLPRESVASALAFAPEAETSRFEREVAILEKIRRSL